MRRESTMTGALRPASVDDIDTIMRIERLPGYDMFIGASSREDHAAMLRSRDGALYVWTPDTAVRGFAMLTKLTSEHRVVQLKRIAIDAPGAGMGAQFVQAVIDHVFETTHAHRLELDTSAENPRARRVYEKLGFIHEGRVRDVYLLEDGRYVSSDLFSMLRPEWDARR